MSEPATAYQEVPDNGSSDAELYRGGSAYWATELPRLQPGMLLPRKDARAAAFPFNAPNVQYVHFARNAIYFIAQQMGLVGAEVLFPAYFHGVELEALIAAGVRPRFFAVHSGMRVDPEDIVQALTPQTRAVYLIHYAGFPGPVEAVRDICRDRGLLFIEDCALALLSKAGEAPLGSFGDAAVFCIYKTLPTPDGGAVVLKDGRLDIHGVPTTFMATARQTAAAMLGHLEAQGRPVVRALARTVKALGKAATRRRASDWVDVGTQNFDVSDVNLMMSDISHRIVAAQNFEQIVALRRRNYLHLQSLLTPLAAPVHASLPEGVCPLFFPFATSRKRELWKRLRHDGVQSVLFWLPGGLGPAHGEYPEVDILRETILELPCHQDMTADGIERLARTVYALVRDFDA
jgi:perosamine synthetase